ncbi:MAG: phosphate signaling complex protein PhoU [Paludibacter sp.]|nr:phosphate signaling complex protein PhoU [Paludibacter sp.]
MMKHTESELVDIKNSISEMWNLVQSQFEKAKTALLNSDEDLARVVISTEKRVNAFELKIDSDCENYIALFSPVAIDLRLVLSMIKINKTLERIGDFADGIARFVLESDEHGSHLELLKEIDVETMLVAVETMLEKTLQAITTENTAQAGMVFSIDNSIDTLYAEAIKKLAGHVVTNPNDALYVLHLMTVLRKIERAGDHCNNIMEEIVFYLDAKVLKHQKK